jgi:hypothetical protein
MLSYTAGSLPQRTIVYDGENRPLVVTSGGNATVLTYAPDGERAAKVSGLSGTTWYLGNDNEVQLSGTATTNTSYLHPDVRRRGSATDDRRAANSGWRRKATPENSRAWCAAQ